MTTFVHALEIDGDRCAGKLACMRVCPTHAIRVRDGKVRISSTLCIDCGECIVACPQGAIKAFTDSWEDVENFPFKVAITSPTLFGQFPTAISPADIVEGLLAIGFDAVYDISIESELVSMAIQDYLDEYRGPLPLIASTCPVVVRLIQVSYPDMVDQVIPIEPPREIAGREMKKRFVEQEGIPIGHIGAIYISPCPAKMVAIKQPAEGVKSHLDVAIGINDIYNPLLAAITRRERDRNGQSKVLKDFNIKSKLFLNLALTEGQSQALRDCRYVSVAQLPNIIRIFEDIEKGKLKNVQFLECYACNAGCIGGPLAVDERFLARSKILELIGDLGESEKRIAYEITQRYVKGDYFIRQPLKPRPAKSRPGGLKEQIKRVKMREEFIKVLPGIDCGLCGAPTCAAFASDVANGEAKPTDCVMVSTERLDVLRSVYDVGATSFPVDSE